MYRLTNTDTVLRIEDNTYIPNDLNNKDYYEYTKWLEAGNTPEPYVEPTVVPQTISDRQFFEQLSILGVISQDDALASNAAVIPPPLLALIDSLPTDQQFGAKMLIGGATVFERNHPMTIAIATAYGWSSDQIDNLFTEAAKL